MAPKRFGIFLPVRNGSAYVREAVESIIAQNNENWELFVLDNASTDGTVKLVAGYQHPRIHIYQSALPLSIWDSWHRVWELMDDDSFKVEFATMIGHDDILLPNFLDSISRLIAEQPNASLYQTGYDMIDGRGNLIRPCRPIPSHESSEDFLAARLSGLRDSVGTGYVFRSVDYLKVGGIPNTPSLLYADDLLFARLTHLGYKAASSDSECLYRLHRASASNQMTGERIKNQIRALGEYVEFLENEFPKFLKSRTGKNALASLLAREVLVLSPLAKSWILGDETCKRIAQLKDMYIRSCVSMDYREWFGVNFVTRNIYIFSKRIFLLYVIIRGICKI